MFGVIVLCRPPIGGHLGHLLDSTDDSSGVSFTVGGETFHAHRAVLAARSPVLKAQLAARLHGGGQDEPRHAARHQARDVPDPAAIHVTDKLPRDKELGETSSATAIEVFQDLLAAADMFQLDRLKLLCAQKLWERVSPENVAAVLICAETHSCPELKNRCLEFFVDKNFKVAVLTEGYFRLMQSFPSLIDEIRERVQS
nr:unnamed protein product [Digitaria exilis]